MLPDDYDLPSYDGPTVQFVIHYHAVSQEEQALLFARRLFAELDYRIASLSLIPWDHDDFDVWLNGERVHSTRATGREPSVAQTVALAWECLGGRGAGSTTQGGSFDGGNATATSADT